MKKTLRGWNAFIICMLVNFVLQGLVSNQQGLLLEPITSDLGMSRTLYSSLDAFTQFTNVVFSLTLSFFISKVGMKRLVCIGSFGPAAYCFLMAGASYLPELAALLIGVGEAALGFGLAWTSVVPLSVLLNNWFAKRQGLLIGITNASAGLGGAIFSPLILMSIVSLDWEMSLLIRGVICLAAAIIICAIIKVEPDEDEARVWEGEEELSKAVAEAAEEDGLTFKEALRTYKFWLCIAFFFIAVTFAYPPTAVISAYATDCGFMAHAGTLASFMFAVRLLVTMPYGTLIEKFGARKVLATTLLVICAGCILMANENAGIVTFYIGAGAFGFIFAIMTVAIPMLVKELFGSVEFAKKQSFMFAASIMGCVIGYPLYNIGFDILGNYRIMFLCSFGFLLISIILLLVITKKAKA